MAQIGRWIDFLGRKVTLLLVLGTVLGLVLFAVELAFAYGLQLFLIELGVSTPTSAAVPEWLAQLTFSRVFVFISCLAVLRGLLQWAQVYLPGAAAEQFRFLQRKRLVSWIFGSQSMSGTDSNVLFNERTNLSGAAVMQVQTAVIQLTTSALLVFSLLKISFFMTLGSLLLLAFVAVPLRMVGGSIRRSGNEITREWEKMTRVLILSIKNLLLLRIYGMHETEEARAGKSLSSYRDHTLNLYFLSGMVFALPQIVGVILICCMAVYGKSHLGLAPGILLSFFYLYVRGLQNVSSLSTTFTNLMFNWPQLRALKLWFDQMPGTQPKGQSGGAQTGDLGLRASSPGPVGWSLEKLSFSYAGSKAVIDDFSLEMLPGSTTVIFGPSGVGKSTLLNLLLGELVPEKGRIVVRWDQVVCALDEIKPTLLQNIGFVGPESFLFEGTIRDNLIYGLRREPSPERLDEIVRMAECQFIFDLPGGYAHGITDQGQGLSAGQKQRLSLARALLRSPKALILDEATSNLDTETEKRLVETLKQLKGKTTIVAVTHRQALAEIADQRVNL